MSSQRKKDKLFHFKQFSVRHDRSGMKIGTDGVLLGAWVNVIHSKNILDIGTGTGVIALMLAQRTDSNTKIVAVEIDEEAHQDALENFTSSPWNDRLTLHSGAIQNFNTAQKFDLIISNPPYFQNSYKPPKANRETARHTETLSFSELLTAADSLLSSSGRLSVILPTAESEIFTSLASQKQYFCTRKWSFRSRSHKPIERFLLEYSKQHSLPEEGEIILYHSGEEWSSDYQKLTKEFYLKL